MSDFSVDPNISLDDAVGLIQGAYQQALGRFQQLGFQEPRKPMFDGQIPSDLTKLSDNDLGSLLTLLTEWNNFVGSMTARSQMELKTAQEVFDLVEAKLSALYHRDEEGKRRSDAERKFAVRCDQRYAHARAQLITAEAYNTILGAVVDAASKSYAAVSRRITQRGQEIERGNRTMNVQNMPVPGQPMFRRP